MSVNLALINGVPLTNTSGNLDVNLKASGITLPTLDTNSGTINTNIGLLSGSVTSSKMNVRLSDGSGNAITSSTNALDVNLKSSSITESINLSQIGSTSVLSNSGLNGAGAQRITVATDDTNVKRLTDLYYWLYDYKDWVYVNALDYLKYNTQIYWGTMLTTVSGSALSKADINGQPSFIVGATSENQMQSRYIMPNVRPVARWDFEVNYGIQNSDSTSYIMFGLRYNTNLAFTNASQQKNISFKLYRNGGTTAAVQFTYASNSFNSITANCNISNTFASNLLGFNRWTIFLFEHTAVLGFWNDRNIFNPNCFFTDFLNGYTGGSNAATTQNAMYKPFALFYNQSASAIQDIQFNWLFYMPKVQIDYLSSSLSPFRILTFDFTTHTYASSNYEALFWLQYTSIGVHTNVWIPMILVVNFYSNGVISTVQLAYASDNSNTLSGQVQNQTLYMQPNRALTITNALIPLKTDMILNLTMKQMVLQNVYLYLGLNDALTTMPVLYCQGKGTITNSIQFSMDVYCI